MKCRLCDVELNDGNRCKAHIMPRGLLRSMSPKELGNLLIVGTDMGKKRRAPGGLYDQDILCNVCDNKFGIYDLYALDFINNSKLIKHPSGVGWSISGADQNKLKLFCLSYLWRASITSLEEFRGTDLGAIHEERIRQILLAQDPGEVDSYTTIFAKFVRADDNLGAVMFPAKVRIRNLTYYEAYLPRLYKFWVKVDSQVDPIMSSNSLGGNKSIFIHNRGNFDSSIEKEIMVRAANNSN